MCKYIFTPIAHRGGSEVAFENTFQAFTDAYDLGYRWLETDVQVSKDGVLYAIHDNLKNITGKNVKIHDLSSDDLDQILIEENIIFLGLKNYFKILMMQLSTWIPKT